MRAILIKKLYQMGNYISIGQSKLIMVTNEAGSAQCGVATLHIAGTHAVP